MTPKRVIVEGEDDRVFLGWLCSSCETPWLLAGFDDAKSRATACCSEICEHCGSAAPKGRYLCAACLEKVEAAAEAGRFAKATKIALADYQGEMVYLPREDEGGYVQAEDALGEAQERGLTYVWATEIEEAAFNLEDALSQHIGDNHHEDAYDGVDVGLVEKAQALIDEAIKDVRTFHQDPTVAILIPPVEAAAADGEPEEDGGVAAPVGPVPAQP